MGRGLARGEGTGIVHIATGCGREDFELGRSLGLPVLTPVDEAGRFYDDYGWLHGLSTVEAADQIVGDLAERGFLVEAGHVRPPLPALLALRHAAHLPHLRRLVHRRRRDAPEAARGEREGRVGARVHGQAHGRLAAQHGRLEHLAPPLLRAAAAVLPVRVRAPERDRVEGRARRARGRGRSTQLEELRRPWIDRVPIRCEACGEPVDARPRGRRRLARRGHRPVLDARLAEPGVGPGGLRDRRRAGADDGRPARPRVLGEVVPGRLGLGDARADPALVLLAALHVGRARRPRAVQARARLREDARRARPRDARLVGEHDRRRGRVRADGRRRDALAVLRAAARPQPALRLRAGARDQAQAADVLELGRRSSSTTGTSQGFEPAPADLETGPPAERPLDRWLVARTHELVREARRPTRRR